MKRGQSKPSNIIKCRIGIPVGLSFEESFPNEQCSGRTGNLGGNYTLPNQSTQ